MLKMKDFQKKIERLAKIESERRICDSRDEDLVRENGV